MEINFLLFIHGSKSSRDLVTQTVLYNATQNETWDSSDIEVIFQGNIQNDIPKDWWVASIDPSI